MGWRSISAAALARWRSVAVSARAFSSAACPLPACRHHLGEDALQLAGEHDVLHVDRQQAAQAEGRRGGGARRQDAGVDLGALRQQGVDVGAADDLAQRDLQLDATRWHSPGPG
ncbi:MAG: hypothetical protein U0802_14430 [Candidatus Binatia bacterium]